MENHQFPRPHNLQIPIKGNVKEREIAFHNSLTEGKSVLKMRNTSLTFLNTCPLKSAKEKRSTQDSQGLTIFQIPIKGDVMERGIHFRISFTKRKQF